MTGGAGDAVSVVIDMQRVFADADSPWATPDFAAILPTVAGLVKRFGDAVTFTRFVAPERPAGAWRDYYAAVAVRPAAAGRAAVGRRAGARADPVRPWTPPRSRSGAPRSPTGVGDATMVLCGVSTDCCVLSTAVAAADAGVPVRVVADACAGVSAESHRATLDVLALYGPLVRVVTSADLVMTAERARGALQGLAVGDALGMPTESTPRAEIVERYGLLVDRFHPAPPGHPLAAGPPGGHGHRRHRAGGAAGVADGRVGRSDRPPRAGATAGGVGVDDAGARGDGLLGPSTKRALAALAAGVDPAEAGLSGTTNGAAMRIAPVGIAVPVGDALVDRVVEASFVTHGTGVALAGAAAVAAAVSAGIDGAGVRDTFAVAADAAEQAAERGRWVAAADVAARIRWATKMIRGQRDPWRRSARSSAPASRRRSRCPPRSPSSRSRATTRGSRASSARRSAATATPSPRWQARSRAPAAGWRAAGAGARRAPRPRRPRRRAVGAAHRLMIAAARPQRVAPVRRLHHGQARARDGRLIGVGSVVVDVLATVPDLPPRGGDVWASRMRMAAGGGFHALAAAARQGVDVVYAGAHGTGPFGDLARAALRTEGIAVRLPPRPDADTGVVIVMVDGEGERTFVSGRGAETTLGPADLADLTPAAGDVVLVSGYGLDDALADWVVRPARRRHGGVRPRAARPAGPASHGCGPGWTG